MLIDLAFYFMLFMLVGWPLLTYAGDLVRYILWKLKGVGR